MKQATATSLGFIAASVLPAAYQAMVFPLSGHRDLQSILGSFVVAYYFAVASIALLGVPAYFILKRFDLVTWWSAVGFGTLAGVLVIFALTSNADPVSQLRFALLGGSAGLLFWIVRRAGRT